MASPVAYPESLAYIDPSHLVPQQQVPLPYQECLPSPVTYLPSASPLLQTPSPYLPISPIPYDYSMHSPIGFIHSPVNAETGGFFTFVAPASNGMNVGNVPVLISPMHTSPSYVFSPHAVERVPM